MRNGLGSHSNGKICTPGSVSEPSETVLDVSEETTHDSIVVRIKENVRSHPPFGQLVQFN